MRVCAAIRSASGDAKKGGKVSVVGAAANCVGFRKKKSEPSYKPTHGQICLANVRISEFGCQSPNSLKQIKIKQNLILIFWGGECTWEMSDSSLYFSPH